MSTSVHQSGLYRIKCLSFLFSARVYDSLLLWANAVNISINMGNEPDDGYALTDVIINHMPNGVDSEVTGNFKIDENGDRGSNFL